MAGNPISQRTEEKSFFLHILRPIVIRLQGKPGEGDSGVKGSFSARISFGTRLDPADSSRIICKEVVLQCIIRPWPPYTLLTTMLSARGFCPSRAFAGFRQEKGLVLRAMGESLPQRSPEPVSRSFFRVGGRRRLPTRYSAPGHMNRAGHPMQALREGSRDEWDDLMPLFRTHRKGRRERSPASWQRA